MRHVLSILGTESTFMCVGNSRTAYQSQRGENGVLPLPPSVSRIPEERALLEAEVPVMFGGVNRHLQTYH